MAGSLLIVAIIGVAALLWSDDSLLYRRIIQEDGPVEWMTFWAFALAGILALVALLERHSPRHPMGRLYLLAYALGALAVAMEEISWGQRLIGYQPPETFLADNFQQEFNLHNLADTNTRKFLLLGLLAGFGVLFPLLGRLPPLAGWLQRWQVPIPALGLIPGFVALIVFYVVYPIESTGEWVELGAGMGFACAALTYPQRAGASMRWALGTMPFLLGAITPYLLVPSVDPARVALAEQEARALAADLSDRRLRSRCGVHKRVYTFIEEYGSGDMSRSAWEKLEPLPAAEALRRQYFLDPWNLPYWIRHRCSEGRTTAVFVYSFGPNRRRDSVQGEIREDDVGAYAR